MNRAQRFSFITILFCLLGVLGSAHAGTILEAVKMRGHLRCGVSEGIAGFSKRDAQGVWRGLDVDFCRAVAAAVLSEADKVEFLPLKASARFPALQSRSIDLLVRNTSWTLTREALLKVQFPAVLFYDGQAILVPKSSGITKAAQLQGATVCVEKGTTHLRNLQEYFTARGMGVNPMVIDSSREVTEAFFAGRCQAYTSDAFQLAVTRLQAPAGPEAFEILAERISKEPLGPVVSAGDQEWITLVRWVLYALVLAEENGITRDNFDAKRAEGQTTLTRLSQDEKNLIAQTLGLSPRWAERSIKAVGNYGEMYERNLGRDSPLRIDRGLNRLWRDGGLMYAPPID